MEENDRRNDFMINLHESMGPGLDRTRDPWICNQVRVDSSLSDYYDQEQGVPQGGVLSTTLFSIKINDIVKCLGNLTDCSLYVDDFCICYRLKKHGDN